MVLITVNKLNKMFPVREMAKSKLGKEAEMGKKITLEYLEFIQNSQ